MEILDLLKDKKEEVKKKIFPTEKSECLRKIQNILAEHEYMESNISVEHEYWDLKNHYRILNDDEK